MSTRRSFIWKRTGCTALDVIHITDGPLAGAKNVYVLDPFGNQLEIVD